MTVVVYWRSMTAFIFGLLYLSFIISCCETSNHLVEHQVELSPTVYEQEVVNFLAEASLQIERSKRVAN